MNPMKSTRKQNKKRKSKGKSCTWQILNWYSKIEYSLGQEITRECYPVFPPASLSLSLIFAFFLSLSHPTPSTLFSRLLLLPLPHPPLACLPYPPLPFKLLQYSFTEY